MMDAETLHYTLQDIADYFQECRKNAAPRSAGEKRFGLYVTAVLEADERLQLIADIAIDYVGYHTADDLKELIDEMRDIALNGVPKKEGADDA